MNQPNQQSAIFQCFDQASPSEIYCKLCQKTIKTETNFFTSMHNHLRTLNHQDILHSYAQDNFQNNSTQFDTQFKITSSKLFKMEKAISLERNSNLVLLRYFGKKIKALLETYELSPSSYKTYLWVLKQFYHYLFNQRKNCFNNEDVINFLKVNNIKERGSILNLIIKANGMKPISLDKQIEKINQKNGLVQQNIVNERENEFFQVNFNKLIEDLRQSNEVNYWRLAIFLLVLNQTDLDAQDILQLKMNQLQQGSHLINYQFKGKKINKQIQIPLMLYQQIQIFAQKLNFHMETSLLLKPIKREVQRELQKLKQDLSDDMNPNTNYYKFLKKLSLREVSQNKICKIKQLNSQEAQLINEQQNNIVMQAEAPNVINIQNPGSKQDFQKDEEKQKKTMENNYQNQQCMLQIKGLYKIAKGLGYIEQIDSNQPAIFISDNEPPDQSNKIQPDKQTESLLDPIQSLKEQSIQLQS